MNLFRVLSQHIVRNQGGVALIEFAIIFPLFFLLLFGGIEVTRLLLIQQRVERVGYVMADITSQYLPASAANISGELTVNEVVNNIFPQMSRIMSPYNASDRQAIMISSIKKVGGVKRIQWQIASAADTLSGCDSGTPQRCVISEISGLAPAAISSGVKGQTVSLSGAKNAVLASMPEGESLIVAEVFYRYEPILKNLLQSVGTSGGDGASGYDFYLNPRIYSTSLYFAPRNGEMLYLPTRFPVQ